MDRRGPMDTIERRLRLGSSVMVPGPRRTGKTVVAEEVLRRLEAAPPKVLTAQVDLFACTTLEDFASRLTAAVLGQRHPAFKDLAASTMGRIRDLIERVDVRVRVQDLQVGMGFLRPDRPASEALDQALEMPERLAVAEGCRMVVLLDEFQEIERLGGERLAQRMRAVWQRQKATSYLLLGSYPTMMEKLFANRHAALYRFADVVPVGVPDRAAWSEYLAGKLSAAGLDITPPALALLLGTTGGHPDDTVRVANEAFSLAQALARPALDMEMVQAAIDRTAEWLAPGFYGQLSEAGRTGVVREVMRDLAHGQTIYRKDRNPSAVRRAVDHLVALAIVEKVGRGQYRFVEPLFARYLRQELG